jgi:hypothetical protein
MRREALDPAPHPGKNAHPRRRSGEGLEAVALAPSVEAWRRERARLERRARLVDGIFAYAEALSGATAPDEIFPAVAAHAVSLIGGWGAVVYRHGADAPHDAPFDPVAVSMPCGSLPSLDAAQVMRQSAPWAIVARAGGGAATTDVWTPLLERMGAVQLACAPFAADAFLVLIERRRDRLFTSEDADLARAIVRLAESSLQAIENER